MEIDLRSPDLMKTDPETGITIVQFPPPPWRLEKKWLNMAREKKEKGERKKGESNNSLKGQSLGKRWVREEEEKEEEKDETKLRFKAAPAYGQQPKNPFP